ncbi:MAG: pentapeptide repeat-containing protein [Pyrinomonadaceae bacterium]
MAKQEHLDILSQGVDVWNSWRRENAQVRPDLSGAGLSQAKLRHADLHGADLNGTDFREADLRQANLREANLSKANLGDANLMWADFRKANLTQADLSGVSLREASLSEADLREADLRRADLQETDLNKADLRGADLRHAYLYEADLRHADLRGAHLVEAYLHGASLIGANLGEADLTGANLNEANLSGANLSKAELGMAVLVGTNLHGATLVGCSIHGVSVWRVDLGEAEQRDLVVSGFGEPTVTVDNLEVAQFIYLLLNNQKIRDVIDTITSKAVLILGRFTEERKAVLDAVREELRRRDYLPIQFDFDKPSSRNLTETVSTLAHISRFIIADITDAKSIPQELQRIVPDLPSLPVQPLILSSQYEYAMFKDFKDYPWVLPPYRYQSTEDLLASLQERVINPALAKAKEIEERRRAFEEEMGK